MNPRLQRGPEPQLPHRLRPGDAVVVQRRDLPGQDGAVGTGEPGGGQPDRIAGPPGADDRLPLDRLAGDDPLRLHDEAAARPGEEPAACASCIRPRCGRCAAPTTRPGPATAWPRARAAASSTGSGRSTASPSSSSWAAARFTLPSAQVAPFAEENFRAWLAVAELVIDDKPAPGGADGGLRPMPATPDAAPPDAPATADAAPPTSKPDAAVTTTTRRHPRWTPPRARPAPRCRRSTSPPTTSPAVASAAPWPPSPAHPPAAIVSCWPRSPRCCRVAAAAGQLGQQRPVERQRPEQRDQVQQRIQEQALGPGLRPPRALVVAGVMAQAAARRSPRSPAPSTSAATR